MALFVSISLIAAMLAVMVFDATRYIIPNWLNAALVVLFVVWWVLSPQPLGVFSPLLASVVLLVGGFGLFALGIMGAGDVKLMAALGLFIGWGEALLGFLVWISLLGGALALVLLVMRALLAARAAKPRIFHKKAPIPYGLAIAGAFLILLFRGMVAGLGELNFVALL